MKLLNIALTFCLALLLSCNSKPKVIVEDSPATNTADTQLSGNSQISEMPKASASDMHQVIALEVLDATRYTYIRVKENLDTFWIATAKFDAKKGSQYFYKGGLLKTDFISQENKKIFDKIYLVSEIIDASAHPGSANSSIPAVAVNTETPKNVPGAIKLNDLLENKGKYNGKTIIVSGKCVKANYGIMNKNWIHIQDGTKKDGKVCDFTITTAENIQLGANVAFQGKLILNKDFGAGYIYDIIMEDGKLK